VIDKEIKPMLQQDGGNIEFLDFRDNKIQVRLQGQCRACPSAGVTLRHTVEGKLREFLSADLTVENID